VHPNRLIALAVSITALAAVTAPGAVADTPRLVGTGLTAEGPIPEPPTWPLHPKPVTQPTVTGDASIVRQPPTWPLNPQPIAPPTNVAQAKIADQHAAHLDWGSAGIGAGATLVALAIALVMAAVMRRRGLARARL
jgi:hypothetical protein